MNLFLLVFFALYGTTHLYFFLKVRAALTPGHLVSFGAAVFLLAMTGAPILVRMLEKEGMEGAARVAAYVGYIWMGFLFLFLSASVLVDIYRFVLYGVARLSRGDISPWIPGHRAALAIPLAWGAAAAVYAWFEAREIKVERVAIRSPKISKTVGRVTVVQISDVHLGLIVREERLQAMLARVRQANPDILVSTGDLVDGQISGLAGLAELLQGVEPRYGKYAVTGNHELYAGLKPSLAFMRSAGFTLLRGEAVTIPGIVTIAGVDDPAIARYAGSAAAEEDRLLEKAPEETFAILLKHRPAPPEGRAGRFDLQLSGHVHKGQLFPFNLVTYLFYPVRAGMNRISRDAYLYVSRGTGTWGPPMRFLAPPEVTVIELLPPEKGA